MEAANMTERLCNKGFTRFSAAICCSILAVFCISMLLAMSQHARADNSDKGHPAWRFAKDYTINDVFSSRDKAEAFITQYLTWESGFFSIVRHPVTGFSYDGFNLDRNTGRPDGPRIFSAPSKECLDVGLCASAISGNRRAAIVISPKDPGNAPQKALEILERKIAGYEKFQRDNPGYSGYLPWYICDEDVKPTKDWQNEFPGLDNGEWIWTMLVAERALDLKGHTALAKRYRAYNDRIKSNIVAIFYDEKAGKVRGDIRFAPDGKGGFNYATAPGKCTYLAGEHGVHEGMMLAMYMCLFGKGLPANATPRIWSNTCMKRVEHKYGTTWEGWYGSSHEEWAYLVLPLRDIPEYRALFRIREKIRTQNACERGYPGFATSFLLNRNEYMDKAGIEGITSETVKNNHTFALYGDFPLLLVCLDPAEKTDGNYGLAWLLNMLKADRMQGPTGAGEGGTNDGSAVADVKTIDGSFTIIMALAGGLCNETAEMMKHEKCYERFKEIMLGEYREAFGSEPLREPVNFALPDARVPSKLGDYTN